MANATADGLVMSRRALRAHGVVSAAVLLSLGMTLIVFADYSDWPGVIVCTALLALGLYVFGTLGFRLQPRAPGRIQVNTMLGSHQVDLRSGYKFKPGRGPRPVHVLRVGRKRYRLSAALGEAAVVEAWLARQHDLG